ncbi:hypothetical protein NDU88_003724 [Pleurodeles waltl]|uniref:Uncharacterized protein n=1 Tax=Pleurodeles waltl TaxID=8319 RepID=A0AAV7UEV3_PLEWA|nr:hypothetical protein NDU88_003724 [Pleurodeles waltl]
MGRGHFTVRHIPGSQQAPADYLSRFPDSTTVLEQDRSWEEVCDRVSPINPASSAAGDVSESSDTSLPRSRVAGETRPERGRRPDVAGVTQEGFRPGTLKSPSAPRKEREKPEERRTERKAEHTEKKPKDEKEKKEKQRKPPVREEKQHLNAKKPLI